MSLRTRTIESRGPARPRAAALAPLEGASLYSRHFRRDGLCDAAAPVPDYLAGVDRGIRGIRIGVDTAYNEKGCDAEVVGAVREALKRLEALGATIKQIKLPNPDRVIASAGSYCSVEIAIAHEARGDIDPTPELEAQRMIPCGQFPRSRHCRRTFGLPRGTRPLSPLRLLCLSILPPCHRRARPEEVGLAYEPLGRSSGLGHSPWLGPGRDGAFDSRSRREWLCLPP